MNKLLSVIIPVYNTRDYLDECIKSVVAQSYINLEILIIDDCSTDGSQEVIEAWSKKDSRIRAIYKEMNSGVSSSRNIGIKEASGDLITFVDSDDYIEPEMYEDMVNSLLENNVDISVCGIAELRNNKIINTNKVAERCVVSVSEALEMCIPSTHISPNFYNVNKVYSMDIIKDDSGVLLFNENYNYGEDILWFVQAMSKAKKVCFCDKDYYIYRIERPNNTVSTVLKKNNNTKYTVSSIKTLMEAQAITGRFSKKASSNLYQRSLTKRFHGALASLHVNNMELYDYCNKKFIRNLWEWWFSAPSIVGLMWLTKKAFQITGVRFKAVGKR